MALRFPGSDDAAANLAQFREESQQAVLGMPFVPLPMEINLVSDAWVAILTKY
jgi:hypothetical protein